MTGSHFRDALCRHSRDSVRLRRSTHRVFRNSITGTSPTTGPSSCPGRSIRRSRLLGADRGASHRPLHRRPGTREPDRGFGAAVLFRERAAPCAGRFWLRKLRDAMRQEAASTARRRCARGVGLLQPRLGTLVHSSIDGFVAVRVHAARTGFIGSGARLPSLSRRRSDPGG